MNRAVLVALSLAGMLFLPGCRTEQEKRVHAEVRKLRKGAPPEKVDAADMLGNIGVKAEGCVEALAEALDDSNHLVRSHAAYSLHKIGPDAVDALPALEKAMDRSLASPEDVRASQVEVIGEDAASKAPAPADLTPVRAALAYSMIDTDSDQGVKLILAALKDPNTHENIRKEAAFALGKIGPRTKQVIPALRAAAREGGTLSLIARDSLRLIDQRAREGG